MAERKSVQIPTWSIITVTFNSERQLEHYWRNVGKAEDIEWIVVDNNSTDRSADLAEELGARVIRLRMNRGFGGANNVGFGRSRSPYVAFVNPDVTPDFADLPKLAEFLDNNPDDLVAPQLLNPDGTRQPNGRGLPLLAFKVLNRLNVVDNSRYFLYASSSEETEVAWLMGAVVAGKRERLTMLGPWDTRFFVYYEDSDLGTRNRKLSGRSVVLGDATWVHGWARETRTLNLAAWRRELPSMVKFYSRYPKYLSPVPRAFKSD